MSEEYSASQGLQLLLEKCRGKFRRSENIDYYGADDYKDAERKFVKFCLHGNPGNSQGLVR